MYTGGCMSIGHVINITPVSRNSQVQYSKVLDEIYKSMSINTMCLNIWMVNTAILNKLWLSQSALCRWAPEAYDCYICFIDEDYYFLVQKKCTSPWSKKFKHQPVEAHSGLLPLLFLNQPKSPTNYLMSATACQHFYLLNRLSYSHVEENLPNPVLSKWMTKLTPIRVTLD